MPLWRARQQGSASAFARTRIWGSITRRFDGNLRRSLGPAVDGGSADDRLPAMVHMPMLNPHELRAAVF
jgi:hypothetical protein